MMRCCFARMERRLWSCLGAGIGVRVRVRVRGRVRVRVGSTQMSARVSAVTYFVQ